MPSTRITEGFAEFDLPTTGESCRSWYKIFGDLSSETVPLVILHGGPGLTHHYVLPMADLHDKFGIPVIFYDRNGLSTHLPQKTGDASFWTDSLFHAELFNLVRHLGLSTYDILGHSWGGMMASTFAGLQPKGLRKLVLVNTTATIEDWDIANEEYLSQMPVEAQHAVQKHITTGSTDAPEYQEAMTVFNERHFCKIIPFPEEVQTSFEWMKKDGTVTLTMQGPSEWVTTGSLKGWTAVPVLKKIQAPTLVINGTDEGASDGAVAPFVREISTANWVKLANSTHMPHWEEREHFITLVGEWLHST